MAATKSKEQLVIHQIVVKAPQRKIYDVGNWRTALSSADNGRTKQLYDLLDDIMIDGVLSDAVQKRIDAVTNSELTFQNADGEEVEEIADLMDTTAWEDLLTEILKKKIYGRSGIEMTFNDGFNVEPIPAKHINLKNRTILRQDTDETGIPYEGDSQLLILGKDRDFGCSSKPLPMPFINGEVSGIGRNGSSFSGCPNASVNTTRMIRRAASCWRRLSRKPDPHRMWSSPKRRTWKPKTEEQVQDPRTTNSGKPTTRRC